MACFPLCHTLSSSLWCSLSAIPCVHVYFLHGYCPFFVGFHCLQLFGCFPHCYPFEYGFCWQFLLLKLLNGACIHSNLDYLWIILSFLDYHRKNLLGGFYSNGNLKKCCLLLFLGLQMVVVYFSFVLSFNSFVAICKSF